MREHLTEVGKLKTIPKTNKAACALMLGAAMAAAGGSAASAAGLTSTDAANIFSACVTKANAEPSAPALRAGKTTKMWCAVLDGEGQTLLIKATDTSESPGPNLLTDAWRASIEIAEAKAYTALSVSSNDMALSSFDVGLAARPDGGGDLTMVGHDKGPAPLFGIGNTNPFRIPAGSPGLAPDDLAGLKHHGIVTFAGGQPVYSCSTHQLLGGVGVSGDGVDEDDTVAKGAVTGAGFGLDPKGTGCKK
jgi:uncharacterized protein GlcG (DUF336 family)